MVLAFFHLQEEQKMASLNGIPFMLPTQKFNNSFAGTACCHMLLTPSSF
jgi:hypothetical protein